MAKPILVVYLPQETEQIRDIQRYTEQITNQLKEITKGEYHVLIIFVKNDLDIRLECINSENATKLNVEELQSKLLEISKK